MLLDSISGMKCLKRLPRGKWTSNSSIPKCSPLPSIQTWTTGNERLSSGANFLGHSIIHFLTNGMKYFSADNHITKSPGPCSLQRRIVLLFRLRLPSHIGFEKWRSDFNPFLVFQRHSNSISPSDNRFELRSEKLRFICALA